MNQLGPTNHELQVESEIDRHQQAQKAALRAAIDPARLPLRIICQEQRQFVAFCQEHGLNPKNSRQATRIMHETDVYGLDCDVYVLEGDPRRPFTVALYSIWLRLQARGRVMHRIRPTQPPAPRTSYSEACPQDTNGDGDCGRPLCPLCGPPI